MNSIELALTNIRIAAQTWGNENNPKLLAIHGWLDNSASFAALADYLSAQFYIVAIDLPGHGLSEHTKADSYPFMDYVAIIKELVATLGWKNFILIGHSLGGAIASVVASQLTAQVMAFISLDALGPLTKEILANSKPIATTHKTILSTKKSQKSQYTSIERMAARRALLNGVSEQAILPIVQRGVMKINDHYYWRFDPKLLLASEKYLSETEVLAILKNIQCPVLIIEATEGLLVDNELIEQRQAACKNATLIKLKGSHHLHLESAEQVYAEIIRFLNTNNLLPTQT